MKAATVSARLLIRAMPVVAVLMLGLMLVPAEMWLHKPNDSVYQGFDLNLIYVDEKGDAPSRGIIVVTPENLTLTALPNSQPTVHLVTTPLESFRIVVDIRILKSQLGTKPLRIGIWSARNASGHFLDFGLPPENLITAQTLVEGVAAKTLAGGEVIKNETLGSYDSGQLYHLEITLDKEESVIMIGLVGEETPPTGGPMLWLAGSDEPDYGDIASEPVPVEEGKEYSFGGLVKLVSGAGAYKIDIQWLNKDQRHLCFAGNWQSGQEQNKWIQREFRAVAPQGAAFARLLLGAGGKGGLLFADLFLSKANNPINLLLNGDFRNGTEGWLEVGQPFSTPEIVEPKPVLLNSSITEDETPNLFNNLRLSLTVSATSQTGISVAVLDSYTLTLPHQKWQVVKVDDARVSVLVLTLLALGALLIITRIVLWVREEIRNGASSDRSWNILRGINKPITIPSANFVMQVGLLLVIFLVLNALLFSLGSLPFDMTIQKVWAYISAKYGPLELYHMPNVVNLAKVWGGTPYQEAVFPYNFGFTYLFVLIGWTYKLFLSGPGPLVSDTFALEFVIKSFNVIFMLADGVLIYLVLREFKAGRRQRILASGLFLFNPVVWFIGSIWGQTHLISLFFMLASIWLVEKQRLQWAWMALAIGAINRPQMLVPLFLLGLVFFRRFPLKDNIYSIFWSVIVVFILLGPFSLAISPSVPVDVLANQLFVQEAGGNEPALTLVSLDTYNLWPLVTYTQGARGLDRIYYSSASSLIGELSYQQVSQILTFGAVLSSAILLLFYRKSDPRFDDYLPLLALGTIGFLVFKTGLASTHFVLGLPLLILCRRSIRDVAWYSLVAIWTTTMWVPMYGVFGSSINNVGYLAPALHSSNNIVTRFFIGLWSSDWFITLGSFANLVVFIWLAVKSIQPLWRIVKSKAPFHLGLNKWGRGTQGS